MAGTQPTGLQSPFTPRDHIDKRRSSPAWEQSGRRTTNSDLPSSSPFPSPYATPSKDSPRAFWQTKAKSENESPSLQHSSSVIRRTSLERLKRASRVQNNKLLQQEVPNGARPMSLPPGHHTFGSLRGGKPGTSPTKTSLPQTPSPRAGIQGIMRSGGGGETPSSAASSRAPAKSSILSPYRINEMACPSDDDNVSPGRRKGVTFDEAPPSILQYEMITPEPSMSGSSAVSYDSEEDEDYDDDMENIPVVGPEHAWSNSTPEKAHGDHLDSPFRPSPTPSPNGSRPLPPLPPQGETLARSNSTRPLPTVPTSKTPPPSEQQQQQKRPPLEERLKAVMQKGPTGKETKMNDSSDSDNVRLSHTLVNMSIDDGQTTDDENFSEVTFDLPKLPALHGNDSEATLTHHDEDRGFQAPRISRDSIMRQVHARQHRDISGSSDFSFDSYDDRETESERDVKYESDEEGIDLYSVPVYHPEEHHSRELSESTSHDTLKAAKATVTEMAIPDLNPPAARDFSPGSNDDDDHRELRKEDSHWNGRTTPTLPTPQKNEADVDVGDDLEKSDAPDTPKAEQPAGSSSSSLLRLGSVLENKGLGLTEFMAPPKPVEERVEVDGDEDEDEEDKERESYQNLENIDITQSDEIPEFLKRPCTPENQRLPPPTEEELRTPESVIHHQIEYTEDEEDYDEEEEEGEKEEEEKVEGVRADAPDAAKKVEREVAPEAGSEDGQEDSQETIQPEDEEEDRSPTPVQAPPKTRSPSPIPENVATIKASSGSKLRTRPSATPADFKQMAAARRQVSGDYTSKPPVPKIPAEYTGAGYGSDSDFSDDDQEEPAPLERKTSGRKSALPPLEELGFHIDMGDLTQEFDRVIEAQKRGYLMRQNTKVIHATADDQSSPKGHSRDQSWGSIEPWKAAERRKSGKVAGGKRKDLYSKGGVPPLPGQESALAAVAESGEAEPSSRPSTGNDDVPETGERGRLFVKVIGVKDLALPLADGDPQYFCLTLDNGLHCVTTSWLELGKNAPIGQEFELVVMNDLEFQLTLQTKLEPPPPAPKPKQPAAVPKKAAPKPKSTFSRVFQSPKKRKELERQEQLRLQQEQQEKQAPPPPPTAWDLLKDLVGRDGSFARSYVCLKDFESRAFGRPATFEINCFNEWAVDTSTVKRKAGIQPTRRPPYKIGKLEVQMLFIPKPKSCTDEDMPKSMVAAIRELKEAETATTQEWEGHLSQQGGDCPYWRRRYFKLKGTKFTAFHEATRRPRATIDLSKAVKLIDDRSALTNPNSGGGSRRKSGFSEEEEGYMFVEEGFRIRFANGEVIDFYADTAEDKQGWMKVLRESIGKTPAKKGWCDVVLSRERKQKEREANSSAQREKERQERQQVSAEKQQEPLPATPKPVRPLSQQSFPQQHSNGRPGSVPSSPYTRPRPQSMQSPPPPPKSSSGQRRPGIPPASAFR